MAEILTTIYKYVPCVTFSHETRVSNADVLSELKANMHHVIIGGDQLTAARTKAAQRGKNQ